MIINGNSLQNMVQVTLFLVSLCFKVSLFVCVSVCVFAFLFVCSFVCLFIPSFVCSFVLSCSFVFLFGERGREGVLCRVDLALWRWRILFSCFYVLCWSWTCWRWFYVWTILNWATGPWWMEIRTYHDISDKCKTWLLYHVVIYSGCTVLSFFLNQQW